MFFPIILSIWDQRLKFYHLLYKELKVFIEGEKYVIYLLVHARFLVH